MFLKKIKDQNNINLSNWHVKYVYPFIIHSKKYFCIPIIYNDAIKPCFYNMKYTKINKDIFIMKKKQFKDHF